MSSHPLRLALAFASLLACATAGAAGMDRANYIRLSASVLKIEVIREQGGYSLGSGVVVADERVVTNCHVTRQARSIAVIKHGARWPAQAQAVDTKHDLCLLQVAGIRGDVVPFGRTDVLRVGQNLTAVGYTGGTGLQGSAGQIVALHRFSGARVIQSTNWFSSGASGGGLFDEQQRLVGVLTFRMRGGEAHYFAAPVEWIQRQLADSTRYLPIEPLRDAELPYWQLPADAQPEFLQAATLGRSGQWRELQALAARWTRAEAGDPQAWFALGTADESLEQLPQAVAAYERAVSLDPAFSGGWLRLGLLAARLGRTDRAREALEALEALGADGAAQLSERIGSK